MSSGMDPYDPPKSAHGAQQERPGVVTWYIVYCVCMALMYLILVVGGVVLAIMADSIGDSDMSAGEARLMGVIFGAVCLPLAVFYLAGPILPKRNFAWIYGIVAIAIGMTSACCLPMVIPLLIYWIKPETRAYFQNG
jgi:MFS family permease